MRSRTRAIVAAAVLGTTALVGLSGCAATAGAESGEPLVGLVIKTQDNPFYVKMTEGAKAEADELGFNLQIASGDGQSDVDSQITSVENFVAQGAKAILITPAGDGVVPALKKAQQAGILVLALDSPLGEGSGVDGTFATDNKQAGVLIGEWAKAYLGDTEARIATLDLSTDQIPVDVARNQGFLEGFGIDLADPVQDVGRVRSPPRRLRGDRRERGGWPRRHGEAPAEGPDHQPRLHDQRAHRSRRLPGDRRGGPRRTRSRSSRSTADAPASRTCRTASSPPPPCSSRSTWPRRRCRRSTPGSPTAPSPRTRPGWTSPTPA